jgi:hypothetical protein
VFCQLRYTSTWQAIFSGAAEEYNVKAVSTVKETIALLSVGFEYFTEIEGKNCLRSESDSKKRIY